MSRRKVNPQEADCWVGIRIAGQIREFTAVWRFVKSRKTAVAALALAPVLFLAGARVIIGKDLNLDTGSSGADTVRGKVAAKALTDGKYAVIVWKTRDTPATCTVAAPKTNFEAQISIQSDRILRTSLSFKQSRCGSFPYTVRT